MNHNSKSFENLLSQLKEEEIHIKEVNLADIKKKSVGFNRALKIRNIEEFIVFPMFIIAYFLYALSKDNLSSMFFSFVSITGLIIILGFIYLNYRRTKNLSYDLSVEVYNQFEKTHMLERLSVLKKIRFVLYGFLPLASIGEAIYRFLLLEGIRNKDWMILSFHIVATLVIVIIIFSFLEEKIKDIKCELKHI